MKVTDVEINQVEQLPSRRQVEEAVNPRERNPEMEETIPRTRTPFGAGRLRLGVTKIPGYHMHWIADYPGRLEQAEDNGYEYVTREEVRLSRHSTNADPGERVSVIDNAVHADGRAMTLTLMKIKDEWYNENQQYYLERVRRTERQIKTGKVDGVQRAENYIPRGHRITIDTKLE